MKVVGFKMIPRFEKLCKAQQVNTPISNCTYLFIYFYLFIFFGHAMCRVGT